MLKEGKKENNYMRPELIWQTLARGNYAYVMFDMHVHNTVRLCVKSVARETNRVVATEKHKNLMCCQTGNIRHSDSITYVHSNGMKIYV